MRKTALKLMIAMLSTTIAGLALGNTGDDETLSRLAAYKSWTRATPIPFSIAVDLSSVAG
jgi:hypothetical protein